MSRFAVLVFALTAMVGPAIRYATWPPSRFERATSARVEGFVYDLVFYLWPTQPLAALAPRDGRLVAFLVSVGGNVLLFALIGAGYRVEYLGVIPLLLAVLFYGLPFLLVATHAGRHVG